MKMILKTIGKNYLSSERGGIGTIIATVISVILVLGLTAYALLSQVAGVKDTGDKAQIEQGRISQMLSDPNIVSGSTVKNYGMQAAQTGSNFTVSVKQHGGTMTSYTSAASNIKEGALYRMSKVYDANGDMTSISFEQLNLAQ